MSLLKAFNLELIDKIWTVEAKAKLSVHAKMLYLNCLSFQFKNKELSLENATEFDMFEKDIPNYKKFKPLFKELETAGLVEYNVMNMILFPNVWSKHFDMSTFQNSTLNEIAKHTADDFKDQLYNSHQLVELCAMKHRVSKGQVNKMLQLFFKEQETFKKYYRDEGDVRKHFVYWLGHNKDKLNLSNGGKNKTQILGRKDD
jgi:hypothetical protein